MSYTTGPWTVPLLSTERPSSHDVRPTVAILTPQGQMLLSCSGLPARGEMQANARLIAAAPALLEAAQQVLDAQGSALSPDAAKALSVLRTTVEEALGESVDPGTTEEAPGR